MITVNEFFDAHRDDWRSEKLRRSLLRHCETMDVAWELLDDHDLVWTITRPGVVEDKLAIRKLAVQCIKELPRNSLGSTVFDLLQDMFLEVSQSCEDGLRNSVAVAEAYALGKATDLELRNAHDSAFDVWEEVVSQYGRKRCFSHAAWAAIECSDPNVEFAVTGVVSEVWYITRRDMSDAIRRLFPNPFKRGAV